MKSLLLLVLWLSSLGAIAHPVAQGSMSIEINGGRVEARVRVSNEGVFVAGAYGKDVGPDATVEQLFEGHGKYLLEHIRLEAGGQALSGRYVRLQPNADKTSSGYSTYELAFELPSPRPHQIVASQNVLNEIEFAPGNPWEATFVLGLRVDGRAVLDNRLFTKRDAIVLPLVGEPATGRGTEFLEYLNHGIHHILEGWDHLLFMAALVLAATTFRELLKVVTVFTVAHTVTLALSVFGIFRISPAIVEPMIALSIVIIAGQNVFRPSTACGPARLVAAFGFGLFHGLGFAGGLLESMQGHGNVLPSLAGFSLGVEIGHQVVVLPIFFALRLTGRDVVRAWALRYGSMGCAGAGMVYLVAALRA